MQRAPLHRAAPRRAGRTDGIPRTRYSPEVSDFYGRTKVSVTEGRQRTLTRRRRARRNWEFMERRNPGLSRVGIHGGGETTRRLNVVPALPRSANIPCYLRATVTLGTLVLQFLSGRTHGVLSMILERENQPFAGLIFSLHIQFLEIYRISENFIYGFMLRGKTLFTFQCTIFRRSTFHRACR